MAHKKFKVISVFSQKETDFDSNDSRSFFLLDYDKINCSSVEDFANSVGADLGCLTFRQRLIPRTKEALTIPIGEKSTSKDLMVYSGKKSTETRDLSDNEPINKQFDGIITDLNLYRYSDYRMQTNVDIAPYGLGIVAWAVAHEIPVGLIYPSSEDRNQNFWIESTIDTLQSHPCCKGGKIISGGNTIDVCRDMYNLLKELYD